MTHKTALRSFSELFPALRHCTLSLLATAFVLWAAVTILWLVPLDEKLHGWYAQDISLSLAHFLTATVDRLSSQSICLPVMVAVALFLTLKHRSVGPLLLAGFAEVGFKAVGVFKIGFGRNSTTLKQGADFFSGGFGEFGKFGISFPSGHVTESVLIYGTVAVLLMTYGWQGKSFQVIVGWVWLSIVLLTSATSIFLGYHWVSDLIAGLIYGLFTLRLITNFTAGAYSWRGMSYPRFVAAIDGALAKAFHGFKRG